MNLILVDKPSGVATHSPGPGREGILEHLMRLSGRELWPVHRLDKGTSGAIWFACNRESAANASQLFSQQQVHKTYHFLTHGRADNNQFKVASQIEKRGNEFVSVASLDDSSDAVTDFTLLREQNGVSLWQAQPKTGKPHQIRLHAQSAGIAVLGDQAHAGDEFPEMMLHCTEMKVGDFRAQSPLPRLMRQLTWAQDLKLASWILGMERRERWLRSLAAAQVPWHKDTTWRWLHNEGLPLCIDQLGEVFWLHWFADHEPQAADRERLRILCQEFSVQNWYLQTRPDRGKGTAPPPLQHSDSKPPPQWLGLENSLGYQFRSEQGQSPGLFLDQRANRRWVQANSRGKAVLNLFCYTGGFSVAAAAGGAGKIVNVDTNLRFLNWAKENFAANSLGLETVEFRQMDSRRYLEWAHKKGLRFDLIICDPPSFSRNDNGVFQLEKEWPALLHLCSEVLQPNGCLLFSCNLEGWSDEKFKTQIQEWAKSKRLRLQPLPLPDWDFELPGEPRQMKSVLIQN